MYSYIMMKLLGIRVTIFLVPLFLFLFSFPPHTFAADFRTGEEVRVPETEQNLDNLYLFGGNITLDAPVSNELTTAGGDININGPIEGSALIGGGNITIRGAIGNNARIAGGDITIDAPITQDLVITGGNIILTKNASIGGDILFAGGKLTVDGPVSGKIQAQGGNVTINSSVGGDVSGGIEDLKLGSTADIKGNLSYRSPERAQIAQGATVAGQTNYQPERKDHDRNEGAAGFFAGAAVYKLLADIIICLLFVYFFRRALVTTFNRMRIAPVKSGAIGFAFIILVPIAGFLLFLLIMLGVATMLGYIMAWLISIFIAQLFLGWAIMNWLQRNNKDTYILDWKAAVIGPIIVFILMFIPIFGWLVFAVVFLIALGAMLGELTHLVSAQKSLSSPQKSTPSKRK